MRHLGTPVKPLVPCDGPGRVLHAGGRHVEQPPSRGEAEHVVEQRVVAGAAHGHDCGLRHNAEYCRGFVRGFPPLAAQRYVYDFDEPSSGGRELLGGKGVGLAEMTQMGVPVPAGFTITTDACRAYMASDKALPAGLEEEIERHLAALEQ